MAPLPPPPNPPQPLSQQKSGRGMMGAYNASRADQDEVLHSLRVLEGVGGRQVASHAVTHQHHLL